MVWGRAAAHYGGCVRPSVITLQAVGTAMQRGSSVFDEVASPPVHGTVKKLTDPSPPRRGQLRITVTAR